MVDVIATEICLFRRSSANEAVSLIFSCFHMASVEHCFDSNDIVYSFVGVLRILLVFFDTKSVLGEKDASRMQQ